MPVQLITSRAYGKKWVQTQQSLAQRFPDNVHTVLTDRPTTSTCGTPTRLRKRSATS
jgi:hypothetical protein